MSSDNIAKNRQKSAGFVLKNPEKFDGFHEVPKIRRLFGVPFCFLHSVHDFICKTRYDCF